MYVISPVLRKESRAHAGIEDLQIHIRNNGSATTTEYHAQMNVDIATVIHKWFLLNNAKMDRCPVGALALYSSAAAWAVLLLVEYDLLLRNITTSPVAKISKFSMLLSLTIRLPNIIFIISYIITID
jgi:hypothetical protein